MLYILFLLGVCLGSFLNALEWRLRHGVSLLDPRSRCPRCGHVLRWYHLVPLVSYIWLDGRCAFCKSKISWQYPLVELLMGIIFALLSQWTTVYSQFLWYAGAAFFLTFIFIYDLKYREIPDQITIPAILYAFVLAVLFYMITPVNMLFGVVVGGGIFLLQYVVSKGRWIGGGDIRLGLYMGVLLGWPNILLALLLAYVGGAALSLVLLVQKKKTMKSEIAFGTFLTGATIFTMFFGSNIVSWYGGLIRL